jgi:hypothetical protein
MGRNALVTGVSRRAGIGYSIARQLAGGLAGSDPTQSMPFGRWGCSEGGSWSTGQTINSEGGFRRWS